MDSNLALGMSSSEIWEMKGAYNMPGGQVTSVRMQPCVGGSVQENCGRGGSSESVSDGCQKEKLDKMRQRRGCVLRATGRSDNDRRKEWGM